MDGGGDACGAVCDEPCEHLELAGERDWREGWETWMVVAMQVRVSIRTTYSAIVNRYVPVCVCLRVCVCVCVFVCVCEREPVNSILLRVRA